MAKIPISINNSDPNDLLDNKIYERTFAPDKDLGISKNKLYYIKHSGLNQTEYPNSSKTIASGSFNLIYNVDGSSYDTNQPVITFYNSDEEGSYFFVYRFETDKWNKYNNSTWKYDTELEDADYDRLKITSIVNIYEPELLANIILEQDGTPFHVKEAKIHNVTMGEKVDDLKNWFYEDSHDFGLLNVPYWDVIDGNYPSSSYSITVYDDDEGTTIDIERYNDNEYTVIVETPTNMYSINNYNNEWYDVTNPNPIDISLAPNIILDTENIVDGQASLFYGIYGEKEILLKHKFKMLEDTIAEQMNSGLLKDKLYGYAESDLEENQSYEFKEDLSSFFTKDYQAKDIYITFSGEQVQEMGKNVRNVEKSNNRELDEEIVYIGYNIHVDKGGGENKWITVGTTYNTYNYYEIDNEWVMSSGRMMSLSKSASNPNIPPNLIYHQEYVKDEEMLRDILNLTSPQTLEEKFAEPIKNWNYEKGQAETKLVFDIAKVFTWEYMELLWVTGLLPDSYSTVSENLYHNLENDDIITYYCQHSRNNGYEIEIKYGNATDIHDNDTYYICYLGLDDNEWTITYADWVYVEDGNQPLIITSQDAMPTIDFDPQYMLNDYNPSIITNLIATIQNYISLENKIKDLPNWEYKDNSTAKAVAIPDWNAIANLPNWDEEDNAINVYGYDNHLPVINIQRVNDDDFTIQIIDNVSVIDGNIINLTYYTISSYDVIPYVLNNTYPILADIWYRVTVSGEIMTSNTEVTASDVPNKFADDRFMLRQDAFDLIYQPATLREKFETCLTLERLSNVEISQSDLVADTTYQSYGYNYKAIIRDTAFLNALKVEVVFTLAQIDSENFCPIQDIDTTNGTLTLYVKANTGDITLNRIDVFKNVK